MALDRLQLRKRRRQRFVPTMRQVEAMFKQGYNAWLDSHNNLKVEFIDGVFNNPANVAINVGHGGLDMLEVTFDPTNPATTYL